MGIVNDTPATVNTKAWYQSKTILAAIVGVLLSIYQLVSLVIAPLLGWKLPAIPQWVIDAAGAVLGPIIIYGRTTADTKIG